MQSVVLATDPGILPAVSDLGSDLVRIGSRPSQKPTHILLAG